MAEGSSLLVKKEQSNSESSISSPSSLKQYSRNLSPAAESGGTTGSASSSPRLTRVRSLSGSTPTAVVQGDEDDSVTTQFSESEKYDLKKKMKDKDKKGFFSGMSLLNIFSSPHHHKNSELHKIFTSLPSSEKLVDDYSCALQRDILIHGRLYVTQSWLCFYANIFSWETLLTIPFRSVQAITKEKTALIIPNAIQVTTVSEKYGFSSLVNRDVTYNVVFKCWQNSLLQQPLSPLELVKAARKAHGESTDVGSETDLWGVETTDQADTTKDDSDPMVTMPTHVEIGRIPPTPTTSTNADYSCETLPRTHRQSVKTDETDRVEPIYGSVPSDLDKKGLDGLPVLETADRPPTLTVPEENVGSRPTSIGHSKSMPVGERGSPSMEPHQLQEYGEKLSLGGESINSTEFETVSLMEETGEVPCGCSEHIGRTIINDVYDTDVETIFRLLFTDSDFIRNFNKAEKTINVEMGEWQTQPDNSRLRDLSYTVALNYSFGPKFTHTTEHQIYSKAGQPGLKHIVDTEVVNHNIPYGDTFYTVCLYCVTRVAHNKTRLRVTANIKFKKTCWGLVKNLIERNAGDGLRTHYTHLDTVLKEHIASLPNKRRRAHRKARQTSGTIRSRHKRNALSAKPPSATPSLSPSAYEDEQNEIRETTPIMASNGVTISRSSSRSNVHERSESVVRSPSLPRVNLALTILLGVLILTNMLLYHHLMGYNSVTPPHQPSPARSQYSADIAKHHIEELLDTLWPEDMREWPFTDREWPTSEEEWKKLLNQQLLLRWKQTAQFKDRLASLMKRLDKLESSFAATKKEFLDYYNDLAEVSQLIDKQRRAVHDVNGRKRSKKMEP